MKILNWFLNINEIIFNTISNILLSDWCSISKKRNRWSITIFRLISHIAISIIIFKIKLASSARNNHNWPWNHNLNSKQIWTLCIHIFITNRFNYSISTFRKERNAIIKRRSSIVIKFIIRLAYKLIVIGMIISVLNAEE